LRILSTLSLLLLCLLTAKAQYQFRDGNLPEEISILNHARILNTGSKIVTLNEIVSSSGKLPFKKLSGKLGNLGFTSCNYWLTFQLKNTLTTPLIYYLQTAEPVTNQVNLYLIDAYNKIESQKSGDDLAFSSKSVKSRQTIFKIVLEPGETKNAFVDIRNDGQENSLPLLLISEQRLLERTAGEHLIMGAFYGILAVIATTYFFFYLAIKEISFMYYALYVVSVGLCQFALDGFYHQYIGTGNSWLSLHAVIISGIFCSFFFAKYSQKFLEIKRKNQRINKLFTPLYISLGLLLTGIILCPALLKYGYMLINMIILIGLLIIFLSISVILYKRQPIDLFYTTGIIILALTIIMGIITRFGILADDLSMNNITKIGIGLEIIALSLSMANRIRILRNKKEELQILALQKSEEMSDLKSYFLSNMSHELRTPLNAILGLAAIMEKESTDPKVIANCEVIKYASHGLISSVNDIIDFSRVEKGELKLEKEDFNPVNILNKLSLSAEKQCKDKGLTFSFISSMNDNVILLGDPVRLEQIIHNVLGNAIKFTSQGNVTMEAKSEIVQKTFTLQISIKDTGIGIPKEKLGSIFSLFSQNSSDNKRKYGGFGIGLSIVKVLIDLHQGNINIDSAVDVGTTCEILLTYPVQEITIKTINLYPEDEHDLLGKHILVVEDNPMNQMIIQMMLEDWKNTKVSVADNGAECLKMLKNDHTIDLILMDLQMPVMDGYEAITAIRNNLTGINKIAIPIIVITADTTKATKDRVFSLGADDYMNKPVDEEIMYQKVTGVLSRRTN
jgi:two-component system, sensor histidine kinase LadS